MRFRFIALLLFLLITRAASGQLVAAPDASPVGTWHGTSACVAQPSGCMDERIVFRIALEASDSLSVDARKVVDGREEAIGRFACELNAARAFMTCLIPNGRWRFTVRHDSLVGQMRLRDGTKIRDVNAVRSR